MSQHAFIGLDPPVGKYKEIFDYVLRPDPEVKMVDLCCGLGFGKTVIAIQVSALTLNIDGKQRVLFLEPDWDRVNSIFLPMWQEYVPDDLYTINYGQSRITWYNGSVLLYRPRVITGSKERARSKFRGIEFTAVVDDETAIGFDREQYQNTYARIRKASPVRYYFTISTPLVGPYGRFIKRGGNKLFRGKTSDNHYLLKRDPTYESRQRANMSTEQARRELDGELVALEGRIWKTARYDRDIKNKDVAWPKGNRHDTHTCFKPGEPWWLFCDIGSSTGAYVVVQRTEAISYGQRLFDDYVWVAVADYCPDYDASAVKAFALLKQHFGHPAGIVAGKDINTGANTDGRTVSQFATEIWGNVHIYPCSEAGPDKRLQHGRLDYLMRSSLMQRRFTIARDFVALDEESNRGVREMIDEDQWPPIDERREGDFLPKNKNILVQHVRDALLMGAYKIMSPPDWRYNADPAG